MNICTYIKQILKRKPHRVTEEEVFMQGDDILSRYVRYQQPIEEFLEEIVFGKQHDK